MPLPRNLCASHNWNPASTFATNKKVVGDVFIFYFPFFNFPFESSPRTAPSPCSGPAPCEAPLRAIFNLPAINIALGKIFLHQVTDRLSRQDALGLCYNCQLLLQSLPAVKQELKDGGYDSYWQKETERILASNSDLCNLTFTSLLPKGLGPLQPTSISQAAPPPAVEAMPSHAG